MNPSPLKPSSPDSVNGSQRCMLMELPVELRCYIWHFALANTYRYPILLYGHAWSKPGLSAMLLLNKQIKREMTECFTKRCHIRFRDLTEITYLFQHGDPVTTLNLRRISMKFNVWESVRQLAARLLPRTRGVRWPDQPKGKLTPIDAIARDRGCSHRRFLECMMSFRLRTFQLTITDHGYRTLQGLDDHAHVLRWEAKIPYLIDCVPAGMAIGGTYTVELHIDIREIISRSVYVWTDMGLLLRKRERRYRRHSGLEHLGEEHGYGCFTHESDEWDGDED